MSLADACGPQKLHPAIFNAMKHCYILIASLWVRSFGFSNVADFKRHSRRIAFSVGTGEFRKFPEFLSFFSLIPSSACATFSLFFCVRSLSSSGLADPVGSDLLLPNPS